MLANLQPHLLLRWPRCGHRTCDPAGKGKPASTPTQFALSASGPHHKGAVSISQAGAASSLGPTSVRYAVICPLPTITPELP